MDLFGYPIGELDYLVRARTETIAYRRAQQLSEVTVSVADVEELRRIAAFASAVADEIDAGSTASRHEYWDWFDSWEAGTANLVFAIRK